MKKIVLGAVLACAAIVITVGAIGLRRIAEGLDEDLIEAESDDRDDFRAS